MSTHDDVAGDASLRERPDATDARMRRSAWRAYAVIIGVFLVLGLASGFLWPHLVSHVDMVMTQFGPYPVSEEAAGQVMSMDAWYALLGGGCALVAGIVLGLAYLRRGVTAVVAIVAGAALGSFAALVAGTTSAGGKLFLAWEPKVPLDTKLVAPLSVHAYGVLLVWPIAALLPVLVIAWWRWAFGGIEPEADPAEPSTGAYAGSGGTTGS